MKGKTREHHHRYVESYINNQGYVWATVPDWYAGSRRNIKAQEHHLVACEKYGITEIPKGYIVHHIDENKANNHPDNLEMMTISEHMRLHNNWHK